MQNSNQIKFTRIEASVLIYAFRYALDRSTGAVGDVTNSIKQHWNKFCLDDQKQIKYEITTYRDREGFRDYIIPYWDEILNLPFTDLPQEEYILKLENDLEELTKYAEDVLTASMSSEPTHLPAALKNLQVGMDVHGRKKRYE